MVWSEAGIDLSSKLLTYGTCLLMVHAFFSLAFTLIMCRCVVWKREVSFIASLNRFENEVQ
jgi:hypothetical protein